MPSLFLKKEVITMQGDPEESQDQEVLEELDREVEEAWDKIIVSDDDE